MAAKAFTHSEWKKIRERLEADPGRYGLPERVYGSVLLGSFNIRKLGSDTRRNNDTWKFLADVCRRFDLLAVQEIMDDLSGLRKLQGLMGPEFGMIVSDKTGAFPGEPGVGERLGYVFNRSIVRRTEIATDISYDRSKVLNTLGRYNDEIHEAMAPYAKKLDDYLRKLDEYNAGNRRTKPKRPKFKVKMPTFITFIRTPFCVSFEDETFDQIGLFCRDQRMPTYLDNETMGQDPHGPDYGVFDFANLFSDALNNQSLDRLSPDKKGEFLARFEHKVSDHMTLWLRLPLP